MMKLRRIYDKNDPDIREVQKMYSSCFPADERIPFFILMDWLKKDCRLYIIEEEGKTAGMIYCFVMEEAFLHYFAVKEELRGRGYGSEALRLLLQELGGRCLSMDIEIADDEDSEQYRRLQFYQRTGFFRTGIRYRFYGVDYEILSSEEGYTKERYMVLAEQVWRDREEDIHYYE